VLGGETGSVLGIAVGCTLRIKQHLHTVGTDVLRKRDILPLLEPEKNVLGDTQRSSNKTRTTCGDMWGQNSPIVGRPKS
jgi:hypothetical protein